MSEQCCTGMLMGEHPPQSCIDRHWCEHNGKCFDQTVRTTMQRIESARGAVPERRAHPAPVGHRMEDEEVTETERSIVGGLFIVLLLIGLAIAWIIG